MDDTVLPKLNGDVQWVHLMVSALMLSSGVIHRVSKVRVHDAVVKAWTWLSRSRTSKAIDLGVVRKCMYDFLLVINLNFESVSYRFRDIDVGKWHVFLTPPMFDSPTRWSLLEFLDETYYAKNIKNLPVYNTV